MKSYAFMHLKLFNGNASKLQLSFLEILRNKVLIMWKKNKNNGNYQAITITPTLILIFFKSFIFILKIQISLEPTQTDNQRPDMKAADLELVV